VANIKPCLTHQACGWCHTVGQIGTISANVKLHVTGEMNLEDLINDMFAFTSAVDFHCKGRRLHA